MGREDTYQARSASERTNSYDQEVVGNAHPLRMRGLKAFRFAGAIRTLAQLLRRALNFVLDVTYTQGKMPVAQTSSTALFDNTRRMDSTLSFLWKQEARCVSIEVSISDCTPNQTAEQAEHSNSSTTSANIVNLIYAQTSQNQPSRTGSNLLVASLR